jgi:hypothetical protein
MRIYQKEDYGSRFEGQAQSGRFNPERAIDSSAAIQEANNRRIADAQTMGRAIARQGNLDYSYLQGQQAINSANQQARYTALRGLLSLSTTAVNTFDQIQKQKQEREQEDSILDSIGFGEVIPEVTPQEQTTLKNTEIAVAADAKANADVAGTFVQQPDINSKSTAHVLQETSAFNMLKGVEGNLYSARTLHGAYLNDAVRNLPADKLPKTAAEAQILVRELNRNFYKQTGILGTDRSQIAKILGPTLANNTQNTITSLVDQAIKTSQTANLEEAKGFISNLVDSAKPGDAQEIWKKASERFAYGNVGYTGISGASNQAALEQVLQEAAENGNLTLINEFRKVTQVPGQAGTELGKKFDHIIDKYEKAARRGAIENYNLQESENKVALKQSLDFYYNDPSPENRQKAVAMLRGLGTEEALKEADRLAENGLNYDPQKKFELLELKQRGVDIPEETLQQLLSDGTISAAEYKQFSKGSAEKTASKQTDAYIKSISAGLKASMQGTAGPQDLTPEIRAQLNIRHQAMIEDLRSRLAAEVNINPSLASNPVELSRKAEGITQYLLQQPQYKLERLPKEGYKFGGELTADRRLARITVAPGVQDFSKFTPEEMFGKLKFPKSEMDPTRDRFLSLNELRADAKAILNGGNASNRTRLIARNLGISSQAFVDSQLRINSLPSLSGLRQGPEAQQVLNGLRDIPNATAGFQMVKSLGFPTRGAAFITGNIQQESGWHGLREWGQVNGDGTNRNGGLVSWASWANNPARLGAIERHFGKKISQIPETDQLRYMVMEMKKRNPRAYATFMNPNATDAELRRASYEYWGYGHEGGRYKYASNLLKYGRI